MSRYARKKDKNHGTIISCLRGLGCSVLVIDCSQANAPDICFGRSGVDQLAEIKPPSNVARTSQLREGQVKFAASWNGRAVVVLRTVEDGERVVREMRGLDLDAVRKAVHQ